MSKNLSVVAACVTLLASSNGFAGFQINDTNKVTVSSSDAVKVVSLGTFTTTDPTMVNAFRLDATAAPTELVTGDGTFAPSNPGSYINYLEASTYEVFLINGRNASNIADSVGTYTVTFSNNVAGIIASNAYSFKGITNESVRSQYNVWGNLDHDGILAAVASALADTDFNPNDSTSLGDRSTTLNDLQNDNAAYAFSGSGTDTRRAIEVNDKNEPNNPDNILYLSGKSLQYFVNAPVWGAEFSLVFTKAVIATPEPTTFAVWGLCGMGAMLAGRRRMRRLAA